MTEPAPTRRPFLRPGWVVGVCTAIGVVLPWLAGLRAEWVPTAAVVVAVVGTLLAALGARRSETRSGQGLQRLALVVVFVAMGVFASSSRPLAKDVETIDQLADAGVDVPLHFRGTLLESPIRRVDPPRWNSDASQPRVTYVVRLDSLVGLSEESIDCVVRLGAEDTGLPVAVGDRVEGLARLFLPHAPKNPGERDDRPRLERHGISYVGALVRGSLVTIEPATGLKHWAQGFRERFAAFVSRVLGEGDRAALVAALAVGERGGIDPDVNAAFNASGLAHVLSISGLHLAVAVAALAWLLRWLFGLSRALSERIAPVQLAAAVTLPITAFYVVLVGAPAPAVRAGLGMGLVLLARIAGRELDGLNTLGWSLAAVALVDPVSLDDVSTQLSFFGVLGLVALAQPLRDWIPWKPSEKAGPVARVLDATISLIAASLAATLATAPLTAFYFERATLVSLAANVVAWPASTLIVPAGAVGAALSTFSETLAMPFVFVAGGCASFLTWCADFFASWPSASISVAPPSIAWMVSWALAVLSVVRFRKDPRVVTVPAAMASIGLYFLGIPHPTPHPDGTLSITFLSVGQGDAAVIRFPHGSTMVVDAGGEASGRFDPGARVVAPYLRQLGLTRIDHVVASHPHPDHVGGLPALFERFPVGAFWINGDFGLDAAAWDADEDDTPPPLGRLVSLATARGADIREFKPGTPSECPDLDPLEDTFPDVAELAIGDPRCAAPIPSVDIDGVRVEVLHPLGGPSHAAFPELGENDDSLVLRLVHGDVRILLPGDIEKEGEAILRARGVDLSADLVKAPHHGSRTSSTPAFVEATGAKHVVFCVGERNQFGFPKPEVVARWLTAGARTWRTDVSGAITFTSDGKTLRAPEGGL